MGQSGCTRSLPVVPGHGGAGPGQNRDKSEQSSVRTGAIVLLLGFACLLMVGAGPVRLHASSADDDREAKRKQAWKQIQTLVAEFHGRLPREHSVAIGAAYARYSSRLQDSVVDQIRTILEDAERKKIYIPLEHIFFDVAVRGAKAKREGLDQLRVVLAKKTTQVVMFFSTNRLFRKTHRSLQFVEEEVVERNIRAVFVKSNVDTADSKRWRGLLNLYAMIDEFVITMTADHVRAAHEGLMQRRVVFGTISYGYRGDPIPGEVTRRNLPRMKLALDPVASEWVRKIFQWYVRDYLSIDQIVRRLNTSADVPPPPKSQLGVWSHNSVRRLLGNTRYRGHWTYGVTETEWQSSKDYARQVPRKEALKSLQIEELRIVADELWLAAAAKLAKERAKAARRKQRGDVVPHVLDGLFHCAAHKRPLHVAGANGRYWACPSCRGLPEEDRPLFSHLPRMLALRLTCEALAGRIREDRDLVQRVSDAARVYASGLQQPDPARIKALETKIAKAESRINFVMRNLGETEEDQAEAQFVLRELRRDRAMDRADLESLRSLAGSCIEVPTNDEIGKCMNGIAEILVAAVEGSLGEGAGRVRALIDHLTGGRIDLVQEGERKRHGGWLSGRFRIRCLRGLTGHLLGLELSDAVEEAEVEVEIHFRSEESAIPEEKIREVVSLFEDDILIKQIAQKTSLGRNTVSKILNQVFAERGQDRPDGRTRRTELGIKHLEAPLYQRIADQVAERAQHEELFHEIAVALSVHIATVHAAWAYWHERQGLPVPDGRTRRKSLLRKSAR
ncbi:MAG: recombinase family protein [Gemmataceae bacterium]